MEDRRNYRYTKDCSNSHRRELTKNDVYVLKK